MTVLGVVFDDMMRDNSYVDDILTEVAYASSNEDGFNLINHNTIEYDIFMTDFQ
jgi:hypothetical protein